MAETFPTDITTEEEGYGFRLAPSPTGGHVVLARVGQGLRALKVRRADGAIEYVVTDEALRPLYTVAKSIDELRVRFPR